MGIRISHVVQHLCVAKGHGAKSVPTFFANRSSTWCLSGIMAIYNVSNFRGLSFHDALNKKFFLWSYFSFTIARLHLVGKE